MALRDSLGFLIIASAAAVSGSASIGRADDAYLCGPDKLVYVKADELEEKKRTDPCIAAYYGLKIEGQDESGATLGNANAAAVPGNTPAAKSAPQISFKKSVELETSKRRAGEFEHQAALGPPVASPGTDYRHVRIINGESSEDTWFYHAR